jgi:imidazolonepropionase-like amidohydrolase
MNERPTAPNADAEATDGTWAIVGATVHPIVTGPIPDGVVVVRDGTIAALGDASTVVPSGALIIDGAGAVVLPGFIDAHTHIGTMESGEGWAGDDHDESTSPVTPQLRAVDAVNPADRAFRDALSGGVLAVGVNPGSCNAIGGQSAALRTVGRTVDDMVLLAPAGMKSALGENPKKHYGGQGLMPSTRMGTAALIRQALTQAAADLSRLRAGGDPLEPVDLGRRALMAVLAGEIPWRQHVHRADDIATALRLADEFGLRLVIDHGTEAHLLADVIAARGVPVLLGPLLSGRVKVEMRNADFRNAAILHDAGVEVSLVTDHPVIPVEHARLQAALAVRAGMPESAALRALTLNPARALGVADRIGSLRVGWDADLVLWSGHPLDMSSRVTGAWVRGRPVHGPLEHG